MDRQLDIQTADALQIQLPIAGPGGRSYAFIIDWHIRVLFVLCWILAIPLVFSPLAEWTEFFQNFNANPRWLLWLFFAPPLIVYFLYHPLLEWLMRGRTPGKRMAGVRIVTLQGHTPGVGPILIRNIFRLIDSLPAWYMLGLLTTMVTKNAVRIGDIAAGTLLVYEEKVASKTLQALAANTTGFRLNPQQWELVNELLARWKQLDSPERRALASQLLSSLGEILPVSSGGTGNDQVLYQRLLEIQQGSGGGD